MFLVGIVSRNSRSALSSELSEDERNARRALLMKKHRCATRSETFSPPSCPAEDVSRFCLVREPFGG
jgi:hypothetical protein